MGVRDYDMTNHNIWYHRNWVDSYLYDTSYSLVKDPLWRGRFYVRRTASKLELFEDGSGAILHVQIRFYDKKTHKYRDMWTDALDMQHWMFMWLNSFIVDEVKVWENEDPYNDHTNWQKRK